MRIHYHQNQSLHFTISKSIHNKEHECIFLTTYHLLRLAWLAWVFVFLTSHWLALPVGLSCMGHLYRRGQQYICNMVAYQYCLSVEREGCVGLPISVEDKRSIKDEMPSSRANKLANISELANPGGKWVGFYTKLPSNYW